MLKEAKSVRQIPGEPFRRWYTDNETNLIVWLDQYRIVGFQLIVPNGNDQAVFTWHEGREVTVTSLDDGEGNMGHLKMTPILSKAHAVDRLAAFRHFKAVSAELPSGLSHLIEQKITEEGTSIDN
jgi:hypothetical protein